MCFYSKYKNIEILTIQVNNYVLKGNKTKITVTQDRISFEVRITSKSILCYSQGDVHFFVD